MCVQKLSGKVNNPSFRVAAWRVVMWPIIGAVAVLASASLAGCGVDSAEAADLTEDAMPSPRLAVEGYEVARGSLSDSIEVSGTVAGAREAVLVSETQGVITAVLFELGQSVDEGDPLIRFDDRAEAASLNQAEQQLNAAQLDFEAAERRFERGSSSRAELTQASAALAGARSAREQARRAYENRTIRAPFDGSIADTGSDVQPGNLLSAGARAARIIDTSRLKMRVGVGERAVSGLQVGNPVDVYIASVRPEPFAAEVRSIGSGADPATGSFPVVIEWENSSDQLVRAGVSASARIYTNTAARNIIVPSSSLTTRGGETVVFVELDGTAIQRPVTVAGQRGPRAAISTGLETGEVVISSGVRALEDGSQVQLRIAGSSSDIR